MSDIHKSRLQLFCYICNKYSIYLLYPFSTKVRLIVVDHIIDKTHFVSIEDGDRFSLLDINENTLFMIGCR